MKSLSNNGAGLLKGLKTRVLRNRYASIRARINSLNYLDYRLSYIERKVAGWVYRARTAITSVERRFCFYMVDMYMERYNWYIDKVHNECL